MILDMADTRHGSVPDGLAVRGDGAARCWWAELVPAARAYHDEDWGVPVADDAGLFGKLSFQIFHGGNSWLMMVRKMEAFRRAFAGFGACPAAARRLWGQTRRSRDIGARRIRRAEPPRRPSLCITQCRLGAARAPWSAGRRARNRSAVAALAA